MGDPTKSGKAARRAGVGLGVVLVLAGLAWLGSDRSADALPPSSTPPSRAAGAEAPPQERSTGAPAQPDAASSRAAPNLDPPAAAVSAASGAQDAAQARKAQQLALIESQWCSHGAQAHVQATAAIEQGAKDPSSDPKQLKAWMDDPEVKRDRNRRTKAVIALPTFQASHEVAKRLKAQWIERLRTLGDGRSLATAAYVEWQLNGIWRPEDVEQARLTQLALRGTDPFAAELLVTAHGQCDVTGTCPPDLMARWSVLEPANALSWMPRFSDATPMTAERWQGLAQARYARSHRYELQRRLLALLGERGGSGLEREKGLEFIAGLEFEWNRGPSVHALLRACEALPADNPHRATCAHAADLVWTAEATSLSDRGAARMLADKMGVSGSERWVQRDADMKSLFQRLTAAEEVLKPLFLAGNDRQPGCANHAARYRWLMAAAEKGEMKQMEEALAQAEGGRR